MEIDERKIRNQDIEAAAQQFASFDAACVSPTLEHPHPAAKKIAAQHKNSEDALTMRILRIFDCIAKALEGEGFKVSAALPDDLEVKWNEGNTIFWLTEKIVMPRDECGRAVRGGQRVPTGKLYSNSHGQFVESGNKKIEDMIPHILYGIAAACLAEDRKVRESRERKAQVAARRAEMLAERERTKLKYDAIAKFISASEEWHRIQRARSFLDQVELLPRTGKTFLGDDSAEWISHLRTKLNEQDPLMGGLEHLLARVTK